MYNVYKDAIHHTNEKECFYIGENGYIGCSRLFKYEEWDPEDDPAKSILLANGKKEPFAIYHFWEEVYIGHMENVVCPICKTLVRVNNTHKVSCICYTKEEVCEFFTELYSFK